MPVSFREITIYDFPKGQFGFVKIIILIPCYLPQLLSGLVQLKLMLSELYVQEKF